MKDKLYKFDRVYNLFKDLTDKDEIRKKLDDELQKSYEEINCPYFRDYVFAYAYAHILDDYDKVYSLLGDVRSTYRKYFDYRLKDAYAVDAMFGDFKTVKRILEEAEQMALEDCRDNYSFYSERWKEFIIAWKELLDDNEGLSRCVRHSISRYRHKNDIREIYWL